MNKEKLEEIYIKPENRLSQESLAGFGNLEKTKPVVEMIENEVYPRYIFGGHLVVKSQLGESKADIMITVSHNIKKKNLEIRGRMRYAETGRKTVFAFPDKFKETEYEDARQTAKNMYLKLMRESAFKPLEVPWELEIPANSSVEEIVKLMESSNHFNIGMIPQK